MPELITLWTYATPWERCLMTLALATGFGQAEVATVRRDELLLRTKHPHAEELHLSSTDADSWVMRLRDKTTVYGEWWLMPAAVKAVEWLTVHRPASGEPFLVLTKLGKQLKFEGQRNTQIANAWNRLSKRVGKDHSDFRVLSFNKLRTTSANWIRQTAGQSDGDYLADLFLSHGEPVEGDLNAYTNERWADLHAMIGKLAEWLGRCLGVFQPRSPSRKRRAARTSVPARFNASSNCTTPGIRWP